MKNNCIFCETEGKKKIKINPKKDYPVCKVHAALFQDEIREKEVV